MKVLPDTSVMIASLRENHEHHERAFRWRERIVHGEISGVLAAHSLAETYSTLTRMPPHEAEQNGGVFPTLAAGPLQEIRANLEAARAFAHAASDVPPRISNLETQRLVSVP